MARRSEQSKGPHFTILCSDLRSPEFVCGSKSLLLSHTLPRRGTDSNATSALQNGN